MFFRGIVRQVMPLSVFSGQTHREKGLMNQTPTAKIRLIRVIPVNYYFIHNSV
jgi:hypothetical protein